MMRDTSNRKQRLSWLAAAAVALLLASLPLGAQERTARSTRPQSRTSASAPSSTHSSPPPPRATAGRTRPGGSGGGGRTVVEKRRPGGRPSGSSHGHYYYPGGYYGGHHSLFWRPYWWWSIGYYGYPFYYGYSGVPYYYGRVAPNSDLGGLDLNVRPKKADVYLNGQRIGRVKAFDGYPGYLWLEGGTYDLIFYMPGYQTLYREVTVFAGTVIDVDERMAPGDAKPPEQVLAEALEQRPERRAEYQEQGGEYRYDPERAQPAPGAEEAEPPAAAGEGVEGEAQGMVDAREQPGRVVLAVTPSDASVYLDGRFLGTGEELSRLHAGLMVDPGEHRLSAVRPGHEAQELDFEVASGQQLSLAINLKPLGS